MLIRSFAPRLQLRAARAQSGRVVGSAYTHHLSTNSIRSMEQASNLRYLLILDFEATCGDAIEGQNEIIEIPTLLYSIEHDEVQATFHEYVKPVLHPTLTPFCTNLTGIEQVSGICHLPLHGGCLLVLTLHRML